MNRAVLRLAKPLAESIRRGHPWIYDRALPAMPSVEPGAVVAISDDSGLLAAAWADPLSPIRARVIDLDAAAVIDDDWARRRGRDAATRRRGDPLLADSTAIRLLHGENDAVPGLVIDLYGGVAVVVFDGLAASAFWRPRLDAVLAGIRDAGIPLDAVWVRPVRRSRASAGSRPRRAASHGDDDAGEALLGQVPELVEIVENGGRFGVDVRHGQKTGFFLDQRQNRALIRQHAAGASVLNLFSYTGGFSVHAALGGARHVTSVDLAAPAIASAADNFGRSGIDPAGHVFAAEDAFEFLAAAEAQHRRWDLVIADPPSFAPRDRSRGAALAAYRRLAARCLAVTEAGGLFALASCSSHVSEADLLEVLGDAALEGRRPLRVRATLGAASDHPFLPAFPEGRYLKFILCDT